MYHSLYCLYFVLRSSVYSVLCTAVTTAVARRGYEPVPSRITSYRSWYSGKLQQSVHLFLFGMPITPAASRAAATTLFEQQQQLLYIYIYCCCNAVVQLVVVQVKTEHRPRVTAAVTCLWCKILKYQDPSNMHGTRTYMRSIYEVRSIVYE